MVRSESRIMRLCLRLGLESLAWSLRRLYCPVPKNALVLEVGSGGNPYPRANVLLDAYENTRERHWVPLVADRPLVLGFVERLPFQDKAFDFVIASHVLEHSPHPERFLSELQRVGKAGYIEVPDAFMERVNPYLDHRLEVTARGGRLLIRKKPAWRVDPELTELYKHGANAVISGEAIPRHPFVFHVRYYWQDHIDWVIVNPEEDAAWDAPATEGEKLSPAGPRQYLNSLLLTLLRTILSQRRRNHSLDLMCLLACPVCGRGTILAAGEILKCAMCSAIYPVHHGIPAMHVCPRPDEERHEEVINHN